MSTTTITAAWDLIPSSSPRSACVFSAPSIQKKDTIAAAATANTTATTTTGTTRNNSTNPFDDVKPISSSSSSNVATQVAKHAILFGTEKGGLHYRCYPSHFGNVGRISSNSRGGTVMISPLSRDVHPLHQPIDLDGQNDNTTKMNGSIAGIIPGFNHELYLILVDDNFNAGGQTPGTFVSHLITIQQNSFIKLNQRNSRMSAAAYHPKTGFVYVVGTSILSLNIHNLMAQQHLLDESRHQQQIVYNCQNVLPSNARSGGQDSFLIICDGNVAVLSIGNSFYAVDSEGKFVNKLLSFHHQSSIHPVIIIDVKQQQEDYEHTMEDRSLVFLASGRECTTLEISYNNNNNTSSNDDFPTDNKKNPIQVQKNAIVSVSAPIVSATSISLQNNKKGSGSSTSSMLALLTSDGLIHLRSPACLSVPLNIVEVGTRPNEYFSVKSLSPSTSSSSEDSNNNSKNMNKLSMIALGVSGDTKILTCRPDSRQIQADRIMRLCIDAFGVDNFASRLDLAEALNISFSATSHKGPEPTSYSRKVLFEYLQVALGLSDHHSTGFIPLLYNSTDEEEDEDEEDVMNKVIPRGVFDTFSPSSSSFTQSKNNNNNNATQHRLNNAKLISPQTIPYYLTGTALFCQVCTLIPNSLNLAKRASQKCTSKIPLDPQISPPTLRVCEAVIEKLPEEYLEISLNLLRSCGKHERAIALLEKKMSLSTATNSTTSSNLTSQKYENYMATYLQTLFVSEQEECTRLVLRSNATRKLMEQNPEIGLGVFMSHHPRSQKDWLISSNELLKTKENCKTVSMVVELLKGMNPRSDLRRSPKLDSGRALAVTYLESVTGISSDKPLKAKSYEKAMDALPMEEGTSGLIASLNDELVFLLLEGVIAEMRGDDEDEENANGDDENIDTELGKIYRAHLRHFLGWPNAKYRPDRVLSYMPQNFLREKALLLGKLGEHQQALQILYKELNSLDLALEYCDALHAENKLNSSASSPSSSQKAECAYLPLVKVVLSTDSVPAAIRILSLRKNCIDRAAALKLLPSTIPMSMISRPFLIPALVDSESELNRLKVTASLLRARYLSLKTQLTEAQLQSQNTLSQIKSLQKLNLGMLIKSSRAFKAHTTHQSSQQQSSSNGGSGSTTTFFPDVTITKHFFARHVIIQAEVANTSPEQRTLGDIAFFVAESSDESALSTSPIQIVPIKTLPFKSKGSAWCALQAYPSRMDGFAILTCELRYTVLSIDAATGAPLHFSSSTENSRFSRGRTFVEELQDVEIKNTEFARDW